MGRRFGHGRRSIGHRFFLLLLVSTIPQQLSSYGSLQEIARRQYRRVAQDGLVEEIVTITT